MSSGLRSPVSTTVQSRPVPTRKRPTSSSGRCVADRPMRWRHEGSSPRAEVLEPLERQRQVRAALGLGDRVDLVDDHPLDVGQDLARPRGQHQVERLGRRDQDVGRLAQHLRALLLRRVAGADRDLDVAADPLERRLQVALDVVRQRLERGHVDQPRLALALRQRVARPGGRAPQRNAASVLPDPVGADSSTWSPPAIAGQAWVWASVGSAKARRNQSRTCGVNDASGSMPASEVSPHGPAVLDESDAPR